MAELKQGPLGSISGKVGNIIASNWRAISYVRGLAKRSNKEASAPQMLTRARFKLLTGFLGKIKSVVDIGFKYRDTSRATAYNLAVQENMRAIGGLYPDLEINYPLLVLSMGNLVSCSNVLAKSDMSGAVDISWEDLGNKSEQFASDQVIVVLYNASKNVSVVSEGEAVRKDYQLQIAVPKNWSGDEVHGYLFFHNETAKKNSETVYTGEILLM